MSINRGKTNVIECSQENSGTTKGVRLEMETLTEVKECCYSIMTKDGSKLDIKSRITQARTAFTKKRNLLTATISLNIRN